jgi:hypothetical protein
MGGEASRLSLVHASRPGWKTARCQVRPIRTQFFSNGTTIPLLSTVTESPSTPLATISVQELLKPMAHEPPEVWDASLFDSYEKFAL